MTDKSRKWLKFRIIVIFSAFILVTITISVRAYQLHVLRGERLSQLAEKQYQRVIAVVPKRGIMYDRHRQEMAISIDVDSVYAEPLKVSNVYDAAKKLSPILKMSEKELTRKLTAKKPFVWIGRRIPPDQSIKVRNLNLSGLNFIKESRRFYPNREIAGSIIGFAGLDSEGLEGLELRYDDYLKGETIYSVVERDALGRIILTHGSKQRDAPSGDDLVLTIDKTIQYIAEKELHEAVVRTKAKNGILIVMNPKTGEVLAISIQPQFNPNIFWKYNPSSWRNRAITDYFEPGSTFKTFTAAAALEEGVVSDKDIFFCENGSYRVGKHTINDVHPHGWLSLNDVIKFSSNIGAGKIGERLGKKRFYEYLQNFGFGVRTGIDLPGETPGLVRSPNKWSKVAVNTISFGQGVSLSAIQLITGLCAIANQGDLMKPYIVKQITTPEGKVIKEFKPQIVRRVISEKTAREITSILKTIVLPGGTGTKAFIDGYEVAGKTGTAQKPDPSSGGYFEDKYIASFIGFVPADDPKIALLVVIDEPKGIVYGGDVAAPVFKKVAEETLRYLGVLPTKVVEHVNHVPGKPLAYYNALKRPEHSGVKESGIVTSREFLVPDFTGMSMRQVLRIIRGSKMDIRIIGSGRAVEQSLKPGSLVNDGERCLVRFQQPS